MQKRVGAGVLRVLGQIYGGGGIVASRPGNDFDPMVDILDTEINGRNMLPQTECRALAGGPDHTDGIHTGGDLFIDQLGKSVVVDGSALIERSDDSRTGAGKNRFSHLNHTSKKDRYAVPEAQESMNDVIVTPW